MDVQPEYQKVLEATTFAGTVGIAVTIARAVILKSHGGWLGFTVELTTALLVSIIAGLLLDGTGFSIVTKAGIIGVCAFVAKDIIEVIRKLREAATSDPVGFLQEIKNLVRGK